MINSPAPRQSPRAESRTPPSLEEALHVAKIVTSVILIGEFLFILFSAVVVTTEFELVAPMDEPLIQWIPVMIAAVALPAAPVVRKQVFSRASADDPSEMLKAFVQGNVMCHAILEGALIANLIAVIFTGQFMPNFIVAVLVFCAGIKLGPWNRPR